MRIYNIGRSLVLTSIVEVTLSLIFSYYGKEIQSNILGDYSYFCLLLGIIIIILSEKKGNQ